MALVEEPDRLPRAVLEQLVETLRGELVEAGELLSAPRRKVHDPASLETARDLLEATRRLVDRPGERTLAELANDANLAYATVLSVIDLVKSHTDMPRVPPPRPSAAK